MRSGRLIRAVPVGVLGLALVLVPALYAVSRDAGRSQYGSSVLPPVLPLSVGPNSGHVYIGHTLPPLPRSVRTAQGSGPWPDTNLNRNTLATSELDPAPAPQATMNRVAFATVGVDEDGDHRIDPQLPDDPNFVPNYNVWIMRPDGSECVQITDLPGDEIEPAWDPGSRWIAFSYRASPDDDWGIYLVNLNTRAVQKVVDTDANERHPTFSPDGNWIAYQSDANGNWDIYKVSANGGQPVQLTTAATDDTDPAWCPTSGVIAYTGMVGARKRIFLIDENGGAPQAVSNGGGDPQADDMQPAWLWAQTLATNVLSIVFASNRRTSGLDPKRDFNIWRMTDAGEIDGPAAVLLSNTDEQDDADDVNPAVSPDLLRAPMRVFFESTRADATRQTKDIWAKFITDSRPPELVKLPWVSQREVTPGSDITIYAQVRDFDSGVARVVAILKNPEPPDPRRGMVWHAGGIGPWLMNYVSGHDADFDSQTTGYRWLEYDYPQVATVELFDDGDPANGDAQAGDGIFSGVYTTETVGHDYVIDVLVVDNAGNSLVYDDVYGFTTRQFQPRHNVLFVNDYCEGQSFLYKLGYNNDYAAAYPVESYYLYNPSGVDPSGAPLDGRNTGAGGVWYDTIRGFYNEGYDVWRIICRGPVPPWVYQYYLPTVEYQLDPQEALNDPENAQPTRRVLVADRAIVWASPHTGDLWVADGSLIDAATQADLALFLDRGGRLFISGEDIAWALTMNGTIPNEFLAKYLRAAFVRDTPVITTEYPHFAYPDLMDPIDPVTGRGLWWRLPRQIAYGVGGDSFKPTATGSDPVTNDPWIGASGAPYMHEQFSQGGAQNPTDLDTPRSHSSAPDFTDAAEFSFRPDIIQPLSGAQAIYTEATTDAGTVGLRYEDLNSGARVVYLSFGFEQIHRGWNNGSCYNRRAALMHNVLCWMRTGGFQGRVLGVDGKPIHDPNPIVYCYRQTGGTRELVAAVRCQDDGTYVLQGLPPFYYSLEATTPGYSIDKYDGEFVHGGLGNRVVDFVIKRREPGAIHGIVTSEATGEAIKGVKVCVDPEPQYVQLPDGTQEKRLPEGQWPKCTYTGPDGSYTVDGLPAWDYNVTADGSEVGYGTAGPEVTTVNAGGTSRVDFALPAADGTLVATVLDRDTNQPLAGATVELQVNGRTIRSATTGDDGVARINIQPGQYDVVADAAGYGRSQPQTVKIQSGQETDVTILMQPQPPGVVSGRIVSSVSGEPVGGVTIRMYVGDREIASVVSTPELHQDTPDGPLYNWKFDPAPAGTVIIRPEPEGFATRPAEQTVQVVSGQETADVVFKLVSLHTFAQGLHLISLPGDYRGFDPAEIFGLQAGQRLRLAAWEATRQQYVVYPQSPADRIRPGVGYWLALPQATDLARQGGAAPDPTEVPLYATWNLVGCPFDQSVDTSSLQVRDSNGVVYDWQTARTRGKVLSVPFAFVINQYRPSQSLSPYIGYWVAVSEPVTLIIPRVGTSAARQATREAFPRLSDKGWTIRLRVESGNLADDCTYIGVDPSASDKFDPGIDELKPPPPDLGPNVYACLVPGRSGAGYAVDVRGRAVGQVYRMLVHTNVDGARVAVRWPDLSSVPADLRPVLVDPATGRRVYMRTATGYAFTAQGDRLLEIHLEEASRGPLAVGGVHAAATGARRVQIAFTLSKEAAVEVRVLNIAGRLVRTLAGGRVMSAGRVTVAWDRRDQGGALVPAGQYLVIVKAATVEGESAQAVGSLRLSR